MITISQLIIIALIVGGAYGIWELSRFLLRKMMKRQLHSALKECQAKIDSDVAGVEDLMKLFTETIGIIIGEDPKKYSAEMLREFEKFERKMKQRGGGKDREPPKPPEAIRWG